MQRRTVVITSSSHWTLCGRDTQPTHASASYPSRSDCASSSISDSIQHPKYGIRYRMIVLVRSFIATYPSTVILRSDFAAINFLLVNRYVCDQYLLTYILPAFSFGLAKTLPLAILISNSLVRERRVYSQSDIPWYWTFEERASNKGGYSVYRFSHILSVGVLVSTCIYAYVCACFTYSSAIWIVEPRYCGTTTHTTHDWLLVIKM